MRFAPLRWLACGIILAVGVLLYGHTLSFPFVFDDYIYLVDNPLVKDVRSFAFVRDFSTFANAARRLGLDPDLSTNFILRPVTYFTFYLNYALDGLQPRGFRAVNIGIHCLNALLVFQILARLLRTSRNRGTLSDFSVNFIALGTALVFLVHPLQTESVTYIIQRFTSLGTLFYLATVLTYLWANAAPTRTRAVCWRGISVAALAVGMLAKEETFTAPFMLVIVDWLVMGSPLKAVGKRVWPYFLLLPVIPTLMLVTAHAQQPGDLALAGAVNLVNGRNYSSWHYALTQLSVVLAYLRLLSFPTGLNLDRSYPLMTSLLQLRVLLPGLLIVGMITAAWFWHRNRPQDLRRALLFSSVLWFFVTVSISSSVIPLPDLMAEHRAYLASIGALTALLCVADCVRTRLARYRGLSVILAAGLGGWLLLLVAATVARNQVWSSEIRIWSDTVAKNPLKRRPWVNLGVAYCEHGQPQAAVPCFQRFIQLAPEAAAGYRNLGTALNRLGRYQESVVASRLGLQHDPNFVELYFNLGMAYGGLGQDDAALQALNQTIALQPSHSMAHRYLAVLYLKHRQFGPALTHCQIAARLEPADSKLREAVHRLAAMQTQPGSQAGNFHAPARVFAQTENR